MMLATLDRIGRPRMTSTTRDRVARLAGEWKRSDPERRDRIAKVLKSVGLTLERR